jgi:L-ascorbate metabolism protein UlaG (beta-lactamase superfamily)
MSFPAPKEIIIMQFTYYGHSFFKIEIGGKHLLFDPFLTGNNGADAIDANTIPADYILLSHGHVDHIAHADHIARRTGATIICNWEIHEWFNKKGIENTFPMNTGGKASFDFGIVKCVVAQHSSGLPDGSYGGNPMGFVLKTKEGNFYYSGDTALTMDMQLIPSFAVLQFAILPIGDRLTMGIEDASRAAHMISCRKVIGVHYDTWPIIAIDKIKAQEHFSSSGLELVLPDVGTTIQL